ncbi:hypothetical protein P152DRAFT_446332 [Eremomyces bilateralis CBS 781.70]|uniref:Integral membrane protein n=1 Tax=Eremomyces bilateralis CBS 781.70 TaxID=1392243 RepID=A0A6G1GF23_9PEZI|nr:uncharacterized protein P152DRAFT_446332 [Eremomyces bilateralis CBS 781.70]KAF1816715.1 hypothetical protein P152DRAFT_446332 [Eremomyces bilateralis CBS 781.70]
MAPKGGKGGGSSSGGGSSKGGFSSCPSSHFQDGYVLSTIIVPAIWTVVYLITFSIWVVKKKRSAKVREILPWSSYGLALLLVLTATILHLSHSVLIACSTSAYASHDLLIAEFVIREIAVQMIISIILIPLALSLVTHSGMSIRLPKIILYTTLAILSVIFLAQLILACINAVGNGNVRSALDMDAAYDCLFLVAAVVVGAIMFIAVIKAKRNGVGTSGLMASLIALFLFLAGFSLLNVVDDAAYSLQGKSVRSLSISVVTDVLYYTFLTGVFISVIFVGSNKALGGYSSVNPTDLNNLAPLGKTTSPRASTFVSGPQTSQPQPSYGWNPPAENPSTYPFTAPSPTALENQGIMNGHEQQQIDQQTAYVPPHMQGTQLHQFPPGQQPWGIPATTPPPPQYMQQWTVPQPLQAPQGQYPPPR